MAMLVLLASVLKPKLRRDHKQMFWAIYLGLLVLALTPMILSRLNNPIYRVRVTVLGSDSVPVEDARVWSSAGGEPKKVQGGWEFDIPVAQVRAGDRVTIWAGEQDAFLQGTNSIALTSDYHPRLSIQLKREDTARVRGLVINQRDAAIKGARVAIAGHDEEVGLTGLSGGFLLPSHAASGQKVLLHAEANGYAPTTEWVIVGNDQPITIVLRRR